jgi:hypothetical protein
LDEPLQLSAPGKGGAGYDKRASETLPAVAHLIPLAAWISGVGAGAGVRRVGETVGSYDREQGNDSEELLHGGSPVFD